MTLLTFNRECCIKMIWIYRLLTLIIVANLTEGCRFGCISVHVASGAGGGGMSAGKGESGRLMIEGTRSRTARMAGETRVTFIKITVYLRVFCLHCLLAVFVAVGAGKQCVVSAVRVAR
jgi:hypothetical protein